MEAGRTDFHQRASSAELAAAATDVGGQKTRENFLAGGGAAKRRQISAFYFDARRCRRRRRRRSPLSNQLNRLVVGGFLHPLQSVAAASNKTSATRNGGESEEREKRYQRLEKVELIGFDVEPNKFRSF